MSLQPLESVDTLWLPGTGGVFVDSYVIGLDFGTSNTCTAIWSIVKKRSKVIKHKNKSKFIQSAVSFDANFNPLVGSQSHNLLEKNSTTVTGLKLLLAATNSASLECKNCSGEVRIISIETLCSYIIREVLRSSIEYINKNKVKLNGKATTRNSIGAVVVGVPVSFSRLQIESLERSVRLAGVNQVQFMSESSAAAMSYGLLVAGRKTVAVFDMGGGTTDVTIIAIHEGSSRVLATAGNGGCGGRDYDRAVLRHLLSRFLEESGALKCSIESTNARMETLLSKLQANHQDLYESLLVLCSHAKETLSESYDATITLSTTAHSTLLTLTDATAKGDIDYFKELINDVSSPALSISEAPASLSPSATKCVPWSLELTRAKFEAIGQCITEDAVNVLKQALQQCRDRCQILRESDEGRESSWLASLTVDELDECVLVGGSSRVPSVRQSVLTTLCQEKVRAFLPQEDGGENRELCTSVDPDTAVAQGLAIRGAVMMGMDTVLLKNILAMDVLPTSLGVLSWIEGDNGSGKRGIDGDESIANVSSVPSAVLPTGRRFDPILRRGDRIPASGSRTFRLDPQTYTHLSRHIVSLDLYEESSSTASNGNSTEVLYTLIGTHDVPITTVSSTIPPQQSRWVCVQLEIDMDGMLTFSASYCPEPKAEPAANQQSSDKTVDNGDDFRSRPDGEPLTTTDAGEADISRVTAMLTSYLFVMIVLYSVAKIYFTI